MEICSNCRQGTNIKLVVRLVVPGRHQQQALCKLTSIGSSPTQCLVRSDRRWQYLAICLAGKDREAVGNRALHTVIWSISDKRNSLLSCPTVIMIVAPTCTATIRHPARLKYRPFRYFTDVKPSCCQASLLTSAVFFGAQATARLAALLPLKSCRWPPELVLPDKRSATNTSNECAKKSLFTCNNLLTGANKWLSHFAAGFVRLCYATAAQPAKQNDKPPNPDFPDISELSPQLQQEWHPDNNALLGSIRVRPQSGRKVLWSCPNCPAGCPHIWTTTVQRRTNGTQCPYCQGRKLCKHNSLATKAPKQAKYWDYNKNASTPEQTLAGSNSRADWKCPDCQHEWQAQIGKRAVTDSGFRATAANTRRTPSSQHFRNTPCCMSGTMSAMPRVAYIRITPRCRAISWYIGYAISVPKSSCTNTRCLLTIAPEGGFMGAHIVPAIKCVIATPWQPVSQASQQSGTSPEMTPHQLILLQKVNMRFGGGMTGVVAGSRRSINAQTLAEMLVDGRLATLHKYLILPILRCSCH